jgi:predicted nucleic acid-binding protein
VALSSIVRLELLVQPLKTKDVLEMRRVIALTRRTQGVAVFGMTDDMVAVGAEVRARTGMKLPDALVAASAALTNCDALVGNDTQFKRLEILGDSFRSELTGLLVRVPTYIHIDEVVGDR